MAKESKGQQVKTFKHYVPMPDLGYEETIGKVYFQADSGLFSIYLPEHIMMVVNALGDIGTGAKLSGGAIAAATLKGAMDNYDALLKRYRALLETEQRTKVLRVNFKANIRHIKGFHDVRNSREFHGYNGGTKSGINFIGAPAVHLEYEVLYQVGDNLFHVERGNQAMHAKGSVGRSDGNIIPWTQEREDFFAGVTGNIERLIMAMTEFMDDLEGNLTKAIAAGGQLPMLAAPKPASVE